MIKTQLDKTPYNFNEAVFQQCLPIDEITSMKVTGPDFRYSTNDEELIHQTTSLLSTFTITKSSIEPGGDIYDFIFFGKESYEKSMTSLWISIINGKYVKINASVENNYIIEEYALDMAGNSEEYHQLLDDLKNFPDTQAE